MTDFKKLKRGRRGRLGEPPPVAAAPDNLRQPEAMGPRPRSERYHQLNARVSEAFYHRVRQIAARDGLRINQLIERAIDAYEARQQN